MDSFWIQAGQSRWTKPSSPIATTIDEAVQSVFIRKTEDAIVVWRNVYIPLSYKYDVGTILRDVLEMVSVLLSDESGRWQVD